MNELPEAPDLKDINAFKKKLTWGDVPTIYQLASASVSEMDAILTHGFDNPYKRLLNKSTWNMELLQPYRDENGKIQVKNKPQLILEHVFDQDNYELHCNLVINDHIVQNAMLGQADCPFTSWQPDSMRILFRLNAFIPFITYTFQKGDQADKALVKFSHFRIEELISILMDSFHIIEVKGYTIAKFCQEISQRLNSEDIFGQTNPVSE